MRHFYEIVHTTVLDPFDLHTTVPLRAAHPNRERAEIEKTLPRERERLHRKEKEASCDIDFELKGLEIDSILGSSRYSVLPTKLL